MPEEHLGQAVSKLLAAHPYEEVAYDIYSLARKGKPYGLGRIGNYPKAYPYWSCPISENRLGSFGCYNCRK